MQKIDDREYYRQREANERIAAEKAAPVAKPGHENLAELYAARLRGEHVGSVNSAA